MLKVFLNVLSKQCSLIKGIGNEQLKKLIVCDGASVDIPNIRVKGYAPESDCSNMNWGFLRHDTQTWALTAHPLKIIMRYKYTSIACIKIFHLLKIFISFLNVNLVMFCTCCIVPGKRPTPPTTTNFGSFVVLLRPSVLPPTMLNSCLENQKYVRWAHVHSCDHLDVLQAARHQVRTPVCGLARSIHRLPHKIHVLWKLGKQAMSQLTF